MCDDLVELSERLICKKCQKEIKYVSEPVCMKCGKPLMDEEREYCLDCTKRKHFFDRGIAVFEYHSMASSIYRFKYGGRQEYAEFYGEIMAECLAEKFRVWKPEALLPVPIHASRLRKRGYNQAEVLAKEISKICGIPTRMDIIERSRKTVPQKELNEEERQNNLKRAFKICKNDVKLNTIVIIDDIYTTGSTIDAMACKLRNEGVNHIYFAALAIGKGL